MINTLAYRLGKPQRGDIVAFKHDSPTEPFLIKRVIGLPGERVTIDRGVVEINGQMLTEPYVHFPDTRSAPATVVPPDALYVLGDNRAASDDSRDWGTVAMHDVIGRAVAVLWPPERLGAL